MGIEYQIVSLLEARARRQVKRVDLQAFLGQCQALESRGDTNAGLLLCDQLLSGQVHGRFRAEVLRYKALFMIRANAGWVTVAVAHLKEALALSRRHPDLRALILQHLVAVYAMAGSSDYARPYVDQFTVLAGQTADEAVSRLTPRIWFSMGYCCEAAGEYPEAAEAYRRALESISLDTDRKLSPAMVQLNLAQVLQALGQIDEAMALLAESRRHLDMDRFASNILDEEAQCFLAQGRLTEAWTACQEALQHPSCSDRIEAHVYYTMARVALAHGRPQEAAEHAERALGLAIKNPIARLINRIEALRVELSTKKGVS